MCNVWSASHSSSFKLRDFWKILTMFAHILTRFVRSMPSESTVSEEGFIQCYNKGCGKKFNPLENNTDSCLYHPGPPYFHDAYKIWNCCNKKSTDFGTWLNYPGCTRGKHNGQKPADIVKVAAVKEIRPEKEEDVIVWKGLNKPAERKTETDRKEVPLFVEVTPGAKSALQRFREQAKSESENALRIGAPCRNNSCDKTYSGPESDCIPCIHHPGQAVFHEGMKYWSCCEKKTSNFNAFLAQTGCQKGSHQWSMGAVPDDIRVTSDGQMLRAHIIHGFGQKETDLIYDLWGEVVCSGNHFKAKRRRRMAKFALRSIIRFQRGKRGRNLDGMIVPQEKFLSSSSVLTVNLLIHNI
ncbi:chord [Dictyocaulus viviparus]|uniref:Chord n=1 Tax=Dictyocaulus viviparus TaxID=29172 RepID=A0A0D8X748_DICVI|nr:chord [Dictyocaulus viviparus]